VDAEVLTDEKEEADEVEDGGDDDDEVEDGGDDDEDDDDDGVVVVSETFVFKAIKRLIPKGCFFFSHTELDITFLMILVTDVIHSHVYYPEFTFT